MILQFLQEEEYLKPFSTLLLSFIASCVGGMLVVLVSLNGYRSDVFGTLTDWIGVILLAVTLWQAKAYFDRQHTATFDVKCAPVRMPKPNGIQVTPTSDGAVIKVLEEPILPKPGETVWCLNSGDIVGKVKLLGISMHDPEGKGLNELKLYIPSGIVEESVAPHETSKKITITKNELRAYFQIDEGIQYSYFALYQSQNRKLYWNEFELVS